MNDKIKKTLCAFLTSAMVLVQISVPGPAFAEKQYVEREIYAENFDEISSDTLASWSGTYALPVTPEQWYFQGKTPQLLDNTSSTDKCIAIQPHTKGTNDYVYFGLPVPINDNEKYIVSFDYYAAGNWCDWFSLIGNSGAKASNTMSYSANTWRNVEMTIDTGSDEWTIKSGNSVYTVPAETTNAVFNALPINALEFRVHSNASNGSVIKIDNFRVYELYENLNYDIYDEAVTLYDKFDGLQEDINNVDIKLGRIDIDFGNEELEPFTEECVVLDGDASYETSFTDNKLSILITSLRLEYDTTYTLTIDGLQTTSGKTVTKKEYSFKTLENKPIINDGAYIEYEDFEAWTNDTCSTHYNDSMITDGGFRTWTTSGIVSGKDRGNALTPMNKTSSERSLQYYFVPKLDNDTFIIEYDYYPGDIDNYTDIKFGIFRSKDGYGVNVIPKEGMTAFSGEWGHVKLEVKPSNSTWNVVVTDASGEVVYEKQNGTWADSNIAMLDWNVSVIDTTKLSDEENLPKIDNFVVNATYSSEPKLTEKSISIYEGETLQDLSAVSPASNKIIVDFSQRMLPDDMSKDNIYITTMEDVTTPILTIDRYSDGKYEMSPVDYLQPGQGYIIHVKACHNVSGEVMTKDYSFEFTAGSGSVNTELAKIMQGGAEVTNLADLSAGDAKLGILYKNSTGNKYLLHYIIAFYNGNEMVHSVYATDELDAYAVGQISETDISIPVVTEVYNEINIIAWDSFNGMLPVSESLVLK